MAHARALLSSKAIIVSAAAVALMACGRGPSGDGAAAPSGGSSASSAASSAPTTRGATPASTSGPGPVTEARFCALVDRLGETIDHSIDVALKKKDLTPEEAIAVLERIAPAGARADMAEIVASSGLDPLAVAAFVRDEKEAAKRCGDRLAAHVDASMQKAGPIVEKAKLAPSKPEPR